ncbi:MAG: hypothetical protein ACLTBV_00275 [Enterocloster bolteae]
MWAMSILRIMTDGIRAMAITPFLETLQALKDIGYEGTLALETNCLPSEEISP